jgi:hypothetical protein
MQLTGAEPALPRFCGNVAEVRHGLNMIQNWTFLALCTVHPSRLEAAQIRQGGCG